MDIYKMHIFSCIIVLLIFLTACDFTGNIIKENEIEKDVFENKIVLGYCSTMENIARDIQSKNDNILLKKYESTALVFNALNNKNIDLVLVGRLAKKTELNNPFEVRIKDDGLTLIGKYKRFVHIDDLQNKIIYTHLSENNLNQYNVEKYFSQKNNIKHCDSINNCIQKGLKEQGNDYVVLINWKDYDDNLELVIPVDYNMNKLIEFRLPIIYTYNYNLIPQIKLK